MKPLQSVILVAYTQMSGSAHAATDAYLDYYWDQPSERVLEVRTMNSLARTLLNSPEEMNACVYGSIQVQGAGKQTEINGQMYFEPANLIEFKGYRFGGSSELYLKGIAREEPRPVSSNASEEFVEGWTWYRLPGNVVFRIGDTRSFPTGTDAVGKLPRGWLENLPAVRLKRRERDEWFSQIPTPDQKRLMESEIKKGPALWSVVLALRLLVADAASWDASLTALLKNEDITALGVLLLSQISSYQHQERPWKTLWGDRLDKPVLWDAAALACVVCAYSRPSKDVRGFSAVCLFDNPSKLTDEILVGNILNKNPGYQWAHQLAAERDRLSKQQQEATQFSLCVQLLQLMQVRKSLSALEIDDYLKSRRAQDGGVNASRKTELGK